LAQSISKAQNMLVQMNGSLPSDYFDPHLQSAIDVLPALKEDDDRVEKDVRMALESGSALSAQIGNAADTTTTADVDPTLISIVAIDAILLKYSYDTTKQESMGGAGSSPRHGSSSAISGNATSGSVANASSFSLNGNQLPCYSTNCLIRLLLIRRCRVALMSNKFTMLNDILDNENKRKCVVVAVVPLLFNSNLCQFF
jgi:hypothetical protein